MVLFLAADDGRRYPAQDILVDGDRA